MTKKLYVFDSYLKEFQAEIIAIDADEKAIILDQTVFFPGGGGQPFDIGEIVIGNRNSHIHKIKIVENQILHYTNDDLPNIGEKVTGKIDWVRRYQLMRTHSAMHILCGVVWRDYQAKVTGGNMEPLKARMDFEFESFSADLVREIEVKINQEVQKKLPINIKVLPRAEAFEIPDLIRTKINLLPESLKEIRTIEIKGLDLQADGGTHVNHSGEVGIIRITKHKSKGKINKRMEVELEAQ
jgi:misacylated tRNA(Ala) deacylase